MGVTLRYCDLCGGKLSGEDLDSPQTLKIKDKIFCAACRPKVMAKIEAQKRSGAAQPAGAASAPAAPQPEQTAAPARKVASATRPAPQSAAVRKAPPAAPGRVVPTGAKKAPGGNGAEGKPRTAVPARAVPKPPARAPRPVAAKKTTARVATGEPAEGDDAAQGAEAPRREFRIKKRSNVPLFVVGGVLLLAAAGLSAWAFTRPDEVPRSTEQPKVAEVAPPVPDKTTQAIDLLAAARTWREQNPGKHSIIWTRFEQLAHNLGATPQGQEAKALANQEKETWHQAADAAFKAIKERVDACWAQKDFAGAVAASLEESPVMHTYGRQFPVEWNGLTELSNLRGECKRQLEGKIFLDELTVKASKYAQRNEGDIAVAILERFNPETYAGLPIASVFEEVMKDVKKIGFQAIIDREKKQSEEAAVRKAQADAAETARREREWREQREKVAWYRHINKSSLFNWVVVMGEWSTGFEGGFPVLTGKNPESATTVASVFNSFWYDYVVRFEMNLSEGAVLGVSARTQQNGSQGGRLVNQSSLIDLTTKDFTYRQWVWVTIEVHGNQVSIYKSADPKPETLWKTFDGNDDDFRLLEQGGFAFFLSEKGTVQIRNLETKLISHSRKRLY